MSASDQNVKNCPTVSLDPEMCPLSSLSSVNYGQILSKEVRREKEESLPRGLNLGQSEPCPFSGVIAHCGHPFSLGGICNQLLFISVFLRLPLRRALFVLYKNGSPNVGSN